MTGDKDMMQLVSIEVRLHNIFKPKVDLVIDPRRCAPSSAPTPST